jgi:hypothetical protein
MRFHQEFFPSFVAIVTSGGYLVNKKGFDGKILYEQVEKKSLCKLLETSAIIIEGKRRFASFFLDEPSVSGALRRYDHVDFFSEDPRIFGIWGEFAFKPPDIRETDLDLIDPFLDHMLYVICAGNIEYCQQELMKNAWMFQNPNKHLHWATVLMGEEGTGKTFSCLCR